MIGQLAGFYAQHNIPMMLFKGYGLSLNYPVPQHRPCGDIDIWLCGRQEEADDLLRREKGIAIDEDKHHHTVFHVDGVMVENHYDFLNIHAHRSNRAIERELQRLVQESGETVQIGNAEVHLPPPSANFNGLFLLRHAAAYFAAAEIGLRHVVDWGMFVRRYYARIDWARLEQIARRQNMHRFLYSLNALCVDHLGLPTSYFPPMTRDA